LCWNIKGINAKAKWDAIKSKINESACDIVCLQKLRENSLIAIMLKKFCPARLDNFEFIPSLSASGGSIIVWNGSKFSGSLAFQNEFSQSVELTCRLTGEQWFLTNIYAPCTAEGRLAFPSWFRDVEIQDDSK
jgi:exonuclease III